MHKPLRLGDLQVAILRVLWEEGEATVARVTEALPGKRRAPTTIATMLTKMERRGLVTHRVDIRRPRTLDDLFTDDASRLVHELRRHIAHDRSV